MSKRPSFSLPPSLVRLPEALLSRAANHVLAREPWGRAQLTPHQGKVLAAALPGGNLLLRVTEGGLVEPAAADAAPNVRVEWAAEARAGTWKQRVRLEGDAEFAQAVHRVVDNLRWDVEEDLAQILGDIAARRLVATGRTVAREGRRVAERLVGQVTEYWVEENPQLVDAAQIDTLAGAVRALRDDLARLEKRLEHLAGRN